MDTIEKYIFAGLLKVISSEFSVTDPRLISTSDRLRVADMLQAQSKNKTLQYPLAFLQMNQVGLPGNAESYNPKSLLRGGIYGERNDTGTTIDKLNLVPTDFTMELTYMTNDFYQALAFANSWMRASVLNTLNMSIVYAGVNVDIKTTLDTNLSTPPKDNVVDIMNHYEYTGNLVVKGYMSKGEVEQVPIVHQANLRVFTLADLTPPLPTGLQPDDERIFK